MTPSAPRPPASGAMHGLPRGTFLPAAAMLFLGMAGSVTARSYGDALFLDLAGVARLPYFLVASAVVFAAASAAYSAALSRLPAARLDRALLLACAVASALPVLLPAHTSEGGFAVALVLSVAGPLANMSAWSWATAAVDSRSAKRALPLLGAAATGGAVLFGALMGPLVALFGLERMPLVSSVFYVAMAAVPAVIERRGAIASDKGRAGRTTRGPGGASPPKTVGGVSPEVRRLLAALMLYALLESLAAVVAEYQLKAAVQAAGRREEIAVLLGVFQGVSSAGLLALQVALVGRVLARFGVQVGLFVAPAGMLLGTLGVLAVPSLPAVATGPKLADGLFKFSFGRSALEIAMVPLGDMGRRQAKMLVRGIPGPVGHLLAGGLLLGVGAVAAGRWPPWVVAAVIGLPVLLLWLVSARFVLRSYLAALRSGLSIRRVELMAQPFGSGTLERGAEEGLLTMVCSGPPDDAAFAGEVLVQGLSERAAERLVGHADARVRRLAWRALRLSETQRRRLPVAVARQEPEAAVRAAALAAFAARVDERLAEDAARWLEGGAGRPGDPTAPGGGARAGGEDGDAALRGEARAYLVAIGRGGPDELATAARELLALDGRRAGTLVREGLARGLLTEAEALDLVEGVGAVSAAPPDAARDGRGAPRFERLRALVALATTGALRRVLREAIGPEGGAAARAFVEASAEVGPLLEGTLRGAPALVRERVARAVGTAPESGARLGALLVVDADPGVRAAAARSLMRLGRTVAGVRPPLDAVEEAVRLEIGIGAAYRRALARFADSRDARAAFVRTELEIRLVRVSERLFQLLALGGDARTLQAALRRFHSGEEDARRAVVTLLEDLPSTPLRAEVVAYLEGRGDAARGDPRASMGAFSVDNAIAADPFLDRVLRDGADIRRLRPRIEALRATTLFAGLGGDVLEELAAAAEEIEVGAETVVVREGEAGDALFAVMEGRLRFERDGRSLGTVAAGQAFGELSVFDGSPRSASAVAEMPSRLLRVRRAEVDVAMDRHPDLWLGVARSLARWLRQAQAA